MFSDTPIGVLLSFIFYQAAETVNVHSAWDEPSPLRFTLNCVSLFSANHWSRSAWSGPPLQLCSTNREMRRRLKESESSPALFSQPVAACCEELDIAKTEGLTLQANL